MEKRAGGALAAASLETPTGLRFPSIEASRPAAAPVLEEYYGTILSSSFLIASSTIRIGEQKNKLQTT